MLLIIAIPAIVIFAVLGYKKPKSALTILPIAVVLPMLYFAANVYTTYSEFEVITISTLFLLTILFAVLASKRDPDSENWPQAIAKWILLSILFVFLFAVVAVLFGPGGVFGFLFFVMFITSIISYSFTSRKVTTAYVISTIGASMRQNLPLAMAIESASSGRTDAGAKILRRIKKWLVQGYPLSEAIKRGWPKCPGRVVAMIAAAERTSQLPLAVKAIEDDMIAKTDEDKKIKPFHPLYPIVVLGCMFLILMALMTFVVPKFSGVLEEIVEGQVLPAATRFLLNISTCIYKMGPFLLIALALFVFVGIPFAIRARLRPRRPQKPYLISRIGDFIKWHFPIIHWFEKNYSMVQIIELLRLSLNSGSSVNEAISNTLGLDINNRFKKCIGKWLAKVEKGDNIADSARECKLGNSLAWAFDEKINSTNTLVILEALESFYRSNYSYCINLVKCTMAPCVTILLGGIVGFVVYSIFIPMVAIINTLAGQVAP